LIFYKIKKVSHIFIMKKKFFTVNLIIFLFIFLVFPVFSVENKNDSSIKLDELKLTPIFSSPTLPITPNISINIIENNQNNSNNNQPTETNSSSQPKISGNLVYYTQYGNYYPLPSDCTIHYAGCGPTTVAMIVASYVDKNIKPEKIVNYFGKKGYYLGCGGSSYANNKAVLEDFGIKTTDYIVSSGLNEINRIASDLKKYQQAGWTFFSLANFREDGGGHFFWVIKIDENNNALAYDPWYGRNQQPFNENTYYPFPKYRIVFGVKK